MEKLIFASALLVAGIVHAGENPLPPTPSKTEGKFSVIKGTNLQMSGISNTSANNDTAYNDERGGLIKAITGVKQISPKLSLIGGQSVTILDTSSKLADGSKVKWGGKTWSDDGTMIITKQITDKGSYTTYRVFSTYVHPGN